MKHARAVAVVFCGALGVAALAGAIALRTPAAAAESPPPTAGTAAASTPVAKAPVAVADLDTIKATMQKSRGRTLVVHFWASWCLPCLKELPVVNRFAREMKPKGVDVLSLSLDDPKAGAQVAKVLGDTAPALTRTIAKVDDPDSFITQFDKRWEGAIPAMFVFDGQGHLRGRHIGEATRPELDGLVADASEPIAAPAKTTP